MALLEGNEAVRKGKGSNIFNAKEIINYTSNIISTNKNWKQFMQIKNEISEMLSLLYQHNKITKKVYSNLIKSL